jgi:hypothetical protein
LMSADRVGLVGVPGYYYYRVGRPGKITSSRSNRRFDVLDVMNLTLEHMPSGAEPLHGAHLCFALLRIVNWCGSYVAFDSRKAFYGRASESFSGLPKSWVTCFNRQFHLDPRLLVLLSAFRRKDVRLLVSWSAGRKRPIAMVRHLIALRRYDVLRRHGVDRAREIVKRIRRA